MSWNPLPRHRVRLFVLELVVDKKSNKSIFFDRFEEPCRGREGGEGWRGMSLAKTSILLLLQRSGVARARNPIVRGMGLADPHLHVWPSEENSSFYYIYGTHDYSSNNTGFLMKDWWVWSSTDLVEWEEASVLTPNNTPADPATYNECWATDAATDFDGNYFFYLSIGAENVAVVNSSSPTGPWTDALGLPLLPASLGSALDPPTTIRDPSVFWDSYGRGDGEGSAYIIFGTFTYYIARLGNDMMSLAEDPRLVTVINPTGPYGNSTDDKPFIHRKGDVWYLSWGCFYATSNSLYGPYTYRGSFLDTTHIAPAFRTNDTSDGPWYSQGDYQDRHGSFLTAAPARSLALSISGGAGATVGNDYWVGNDRSHSTAPDPANAAFFRTSVMGYVHYRSDGSIAPIVIDGVGVGEYDGRGARIEAENFFRASGLVRKGHEFVVAGGADRFFVEVLNADGAVATLEFPYVRAIGSARGSGDASGDGAVSVSSSGGDGGANGGRVGGDSTTLCFTVWAARGGAPCTPVEVTVLLARMRTGSGEQSDDTSFLSPAPRPLCKLAIDATDDWGTYRMAECCGDIDAGLRDDGAGSIIHGVAAAEMNDTLVALSFQTASPARPVPTERAWNTASNITAGDLSAASAKQQGGGPAGDSSRIDKPTADQQGRRQSSLGTPVVRVDAFSFSWKG